MLNDIWNGLVNDVKSTKRRFDELEAASMTTNERLNDGLSAMLKSVDKLEIKGHSLQAMYDDMRALVNVQEHRIQDLDNKVNFYSQSLVKLEGKKAERVKDRIDSLEQRIAGQDDQIKVLLHRLVVSGLRPVSPIFLWFFPIFPLHWTVTPATLSLSPNHQRSFH